MAIDVEKYRKKLIEERDGLVDDIGSVKEVAQRIPVDSDNDVAELAQHGPTTDVQRKVVDLKSNRLEKINAALQSIDDGTYGTCAKCGKEIDPRRLDAEPSALTCMDCLPSEEAAFEAPQL